MERTREFRTRDITCWHKWKSSPAKTHCECRRCRKELAASGGVRAARSPLRIPASNWNSGDAAEETRCTALCSARGEKGEWGRRSRASASDRRGARKTSWPSDWPSCLVVRPTKCGCCGGRGEAGAHRSNIYIGHARRAAWQKKPFRVPQQE